MIFSQIRLNLTNGAQKYLMNTIYMDVDQTSVGPYRGNTPGEPHAELRSYIRQGENDTDRPSREVGPITTTEVRPTLGFAQQDEERAPHSPTYTPIEALIEAAAAVPKTEKDGQGEHADDSEVRYWEEAHRTGTAPGGGDTSVLTQPAAPQSVPSPLESPPRSNLRTNADAQRKTGLRAFIDWFKNLFRSRSPKIA